MWHISNQMPFIKYSKLYSGFESVPRKKDTLKKKHTLIYFWPVFWGSMAGSLRNVLIWNKTPEMGEPEPSVTKLIYQITLQFRVNLDKFKTWLMALQSLSWHLAINTLTKKKKKKVFVHSDIKKYSFLNVSVFRRHLREDLSLVFYERKKKKNIQL